MLEHYSESKPPSKTLRERSGLDMGLGSVSIYHSFYNFLSYIPIITLHKGVIMPKRDKTGPPSGSQGPRDGRGGGRGRAGGSGTGAKTGGKKGS